MSRKLTPAEETALLKEATREAHEAMAGLRDVIREGRALIAEIKETADLTVADEIKTAVKQGLAELENVTRQAMSDSVDRVSSEFDKLSDILLGRDKKSVRQGRRSIPDLVAEMSDKSIPPPSERIDHAD